MIKRLNERFVSNLVVQSVERYTCEHVIVVNITVARVLNQRGDVGTLFRNDWALRVQLNIAGN